MRIISNVMKLQSGGEPKRVRYISAPSRNINRGIGDPDRVTSVGNEIAKAREWEANWYKGRKATGKFEDQLDDTTYNFMIDRITNSPITVRDGASYRADGANGVTTIKDGEAIITANADPTYERKAESFGNTLGSILTHELDHAATIKDMNVWGQTQEEFDKNSIKSATPSLIKVNDIIGGGIFKGGNNDYINNAAEVKARLNSMRRDAKMDPARTDYKYKDYKYWLDKYGLDYGKEKSELLMNTVAQAHPTNNGTLFAQEGTVLRQDNTRVAKPVIPELIKAKPRQYYIADLGGKPSTDNRTAAERNRDYWHPFKGAKERFKASMRNGTNPLVGLERTVMPAMAGAALVTTPATVVGGILGSEAVNNATGGFGKWLEGKTGIPSEIGEYLNPGAIYGGAKGYNITKNKLASKFIKGDADLGWSPLINTKRFKYYKDIPIRKGSHYRVGTPFILQQENPIYIGSRRVWDSIKSIPKNPYIRRQPLMQGALLTMKKGGSLVSDGRRFKFKDSPLVRNSRTLNNKRDMRKKFMKSDRPTYSTNRVRKGQDGLQFVSYTPVETPDIPKFESSDVFSTYNIPIVRDESVVSQPKVDEPRIDEPIIESAVNTPMKRELFNIKPSKGLDEFNKWYDEVEKEDPEAKHYRQFLTKMAEQESGFNSAIQNRAGAPAYGYFQFMQDGKKYNNITAYAGTDIETFRNNPKLQIKAAIKLAKSFERGFNKKDLELAAQKGYTKFGLLGGAWLAGNGGVRKYLQGLANPSDRHWSKSGSGTDVASRIQMFNF